MVILTKEKADALCTAITIGFVIENNLESTSRKETVFIYEKASDEAAHTPVKEHFNSLGVNLKFKVQDGGMLPLIIGKSTKYNPNDYIGKTSHEITKLEQHLKAIRPSMKLYGAYIGGISKMHTQQIKLLAPSLLTVYTPNHRTVSGSEKDAIKKSFYDAEAVSRWLLENLKKIVKPGIEIDEDMRTRTNPSSIADGQVFGSLHGMIVAMSYYHTSIGDEDVIELALGDDTCKVASCIPCSIFMSANDRAATQTHFGRGDNWNLPSITSSLREKWENKIKSCYNSFSKIDSSKLCTKLKDIKSDIDKNIASLPNVFLEALTYEDSFLKRITNTFS